VRDVYPGTCTGRVQPYHARAESHRNLRDRWHFQAESTLYLKQVPRRSKDVGAPTSLEPFSSYMFKNPTKFRRGLFLKKGGFSLGKQAGGHLGQYYYCLLGLCGNSGPQKRFRNGRVTPPQRFKNAQPTAHTFSLVCSSIVGGFMASGQGVVEHY
jgi:hypothetical protein